MVTTVGGGAKDILFAVVMMTFRAVYNAAALFSDGETDIMMVVNNITYW